MTDRHDRLCAGQEYWSPTGWGDEPGSYQNFPGESLKDYFAEDTAPLVQIEDLKTLISQYLHDPLPEDLPIHSWSQLSNFLDD